MIVNLINRHGLVPKKCFPESFSCESSTRMNAILKSKVSASHSAELSYVFGVYSPVLASLAVDTGVSTTIEDVSSP